MENPVLIFTNFLDVDNILSEKHFIAELDDKIFKASILEGHYSVLSIDPLPPKKNKKENDFPHIFKEKSCISTLNFLCPKYSILRKYALDFNWEEYRSAYVNLLKSNKDQIAKWFNSLDNNHLYFLCCNNDGSLGRNHHRRVLFECLTKSKYFGKKSVYIYRDGFPEIQKYNAHRDISAGMANFNSGYANDMPF